MRAKCYRDHAGRVELNSYFVSLQSVFRLCDFFENGIHSRTPIMNLVCHVDPNNILSSPSSGFFSSYLNITTFRSVRTLHPPLYITHMRCNVTRWARCVSTFCSFGFGKRWRSLLTCGSKTPFGYFQNRSRTQFERQASHKWRPS